VTTQLPEPDEIYNRTKAEGERRLSRPPLELAATALVAGFDVVLGIVTLVVIETAFTERAGADIAQVAGSLGFGIAFVFIVAGRSELFTENFLVPIAGLDRHERRSWLKLGELWSISPILNLAGGALLVVIVTSQGVLPNGVGATAVDLATSIDDNGVEAAFWSAVVAGGLITAMTWLIEGADSYGTRIAIAWASGAVLALVHLNHVIVVTLELFLGIRYGADVGWGDVWSNFGVAAAGNMVGGLLFVTLTRFGQAKGSSARKAA
jgi:formate/nitrite transporter FocA (FNT family)